jgi:hypothetical protein
MAEDLAVSPTLPQRRVEEGEPGFEGTGGYDGARRFIDGPGYLSAVAVMGLRAYKRWLSPALPAACRYVPSCSEYAMEAVERYGVVRGGAMAAWRILRCHPLAKGGLDLVMDSRLGRKNGTPGHSCDGEIRRSQAPEDGRGRSSRRKLTDEMMSHSIG